MYNGTAPEVRRTRENTAIAAAIPPIARTTDRSGMCRVDALPELGRDHPKKLAKVVAWAQAGRSLAPPSKRSPTPVAPGWRPAPGWRTLER